MDIFLMFIWCWLVGFACGLAYGIIYDRWIKDDDE